MATTNLSYYDKDTIPNAKNFRFGIVVSEWNPAITENLFLGAQQALLENGVSKKISYVGMFLEVLSLFLGVKK